MSEEEQHDESATPEEEPSVPAETTPAAESPSGEDGDSGSGSKLWLVLIVMLVVIGAAVWWTQGRDGAPADTDDEPVAANESVDAVAPEPASTTAPAASTTPAQTAPAATTSIAPDIIPAASEADLDNLRADIRLLQQRLEESNRTVADLRAELNEQARGQSRLSSALNDRDNEVGSLPGRIENLEQGVEALQGISSGSRDAWLLAEAEYYMQIANAQMQLANNPTLAMRALELADQRVRELGNPAYTPVRRQLAEEIAALSGTESVDGEGSTLALGSMAALVPTLPLDNAVVVPADGNDQAAVDELQGWDRANAATREALSGVFRIRKSDERVQAMLSPEAEYFLRLNLQLQLQAARLSLLSGESASYRQSLEDAAVWLQRYFDQESAAVQRAQSYLVEVGQLDLGTARTDISGSLALLRRQRTLDQSGE